MTHHVQTHLSARTAPLQLVIFDCDGVLIDSEPIANRVVADELANLGWPISAAESQDRFHGLSYRDMRPLIALGAATFGDLHALPALLRVERDRWR